MSEFPMGAIQRLETNNITVQDLFEFTKTISQMLPGERRILLEALDQAVQPRFLVPTEHIKAI
jgi:hypothetical protein